MSKKIEITFWLVVVSFIFVASEFFVPVVQDFFQGPVLFFISIGIFALTSSALTLLVWRFDIKGRLRMFLLLAGICGVGFLLCIVLHNIFYAFAIMTADIVFVKYVFEVLHVVFFLAGVFVCPTGFLIGVGGSVWKLIKK